MSAPRVYSISPAFGLPSGRNRVTILGQYFRLPSEADLSGGAWRPTVRVRFNGVDADAVIPLARHRLEVIAPRYLGAPEDLPKVVAVEVANLDDAGVPIPGESVTVASAYTFKRPDLTEDSYLTEVTAALVLDLRRNILENVVIGSDPDYADDPASGLTTIGALPVLILNGPATVPPELYPYRENDERESEIATGEVALTVAPMTTALRWDIIAVADRKREVLNLANAVIAYFERRPYLRIPERRGSAESVEVEAYLGTFRPNDRWSDRVKVMESTLRIEPVYIDNDSSAMNGGAAAEAVVAVATDALAALQLEVEGDVP